MGPCAILLVCIVNTLTGIIRARIALFVIIHFHIFFRMLRKMHGKKYDRKLLCLRFISQVKVAVLTFFLENNDIKCISLFELKLWRMHQKFKRDIIVQKFMTKNIIQKILQQENNTTRKMKFSSTDLLSKCETADLVAFTEEIRNEKLHFLCSGRYTEF